jgi:polyhydroxyalkanoate synthase
MMRVHNSWGGPPFDGAGASFAAAQALYQSNLLSTLNLFRIQAGAGPLGWPARGATASEQHGAEGPARLLRYVAAERRGAPVLLVCSLVNRPYVLDLLPGRSVVEALQRAGRDVWLLDWGTPEPACNRNPLDHYALGLIPRALEQVRARAGYTPHLLGYCMGGSLSLMALAAGAPARSVIALATPVDLHDQGLLSLWTRAPGFDPRAIVDAYGHAPPHLLQPAFKMLDPVGLSTKLVHVRDRIADDAFMHFFLAMEQWLEDSIPFPGRAFVEWVQLYRDNALGRRLAALRLPILSLWAEGDYITPPSSARAIEAAAPDARHRSLSIAGGHIGLATGSEAHKRIWPEVGRWLDAVDAEEAHTAAHTTTPAPKKKPRAGKRAAR